MGTSFVENTGFQGMQAKCLLLITDTIIFETHILKNFKNLCAVVDVGQNHGFLILLHPG